MGSVIGGGVPTRPASVCGLGRWRRGYGGRAHVLPRRVARADRRAAIPREVLLMSASHELEQAVPGTDAPAGGDGSSCRRILIPVRSPADSTETLSVAARVRRRTLNTVLRPL